MGLGYLAPISSSFTVYFVAENGEISPGYHVYNEMLVANKAAKMDANLGSMDCP